MAHGYLVKALHIFLRPSHPCSLDPLVSAMSASQQLPLVQLLASLLEAPKDDKDPLPPGDVRLGSLPYCACVAEALASRCLAKGRKLLCQNSQQPLLGAALRQVKKAATEAAESHSGVWLAARQRCSALDLVAALLTDAAEELGKALGSGTGASASATPLRREQSSAAIVEGMAAALPHLRDTLGATAAAATFSNSNSRGSWEALPANDVILDWCQLCATVRSSISCLYLPTPACQAAAAAAAEALVRLAPLLPQQARPRSSPEGGLVYVAAGSSEAFVVSWDRHADLLRLNPPQCLAVCSGQLASCLLTACMPDGSAEAAAADQQPSGEGGRMQQMAAAGSGNGSEQLAAAAWSAAMTAFRLQWALASQPAVPAEGNTLAVFPLAAAGSAAADGSCLIAHQACRAALQAQLAALDPISNPQQNLEGQR